MKPPNCQDGGERVCDFPPPAVLIFLPVVLFLFTPAVGWAAGTVTNCTESSLRAAMVGGGTVTFVCDGTIINLVDTTLDATGHQITISGGGLRRVFVVNTNISLTALNLTIANGLSDQAGGIYNAGGSLFLRNCIFLNNAAVGAGGPVYSGSSGTNGCGGAIFNAGFMEALDCTFLSNTVVGGAGAAAGWPGTAGGTGGDGEGGAVGNYGSAIMTGCLLAGNSATGGPGGDGGSGSYGFYPDNSGGPGGAGGSGKGGALFNGGQAVLVNNTFASNQGVGGPGGWGGSGAPPSSQSDTSGNGGHGGVGGSGDGAVADAGGLCYVLNCTVALNLGSPGAGGMGGPAGPWIYPYYPPRVGSPGGDASAGIAVGGLTTTGAILQNTLLSGNTSSNAAGNITDAGHNLSSDGSCAFTAAGSLNNTDPKLGPLAGHGGPTLTMPLLPGSPAIDAGNTPGAPATDQRGVARPQGPGVDIGSFEFQYIPVFACPVVSGATNCLLQVTGLLPNQTFSLETSSNLVQWAGLTNFVAGTNGMFQFSDPVSGSVPMRFYRLKSGSP